MLLVHIGVTILWAVTRVGRQEIRGSEGRRCENLLLNGNLKTEKEMGDNIKMDPIRT
jgi:hypothetical protein